MLDVHMFRVWDELLGETLCNAPRFGSLSLRLQGYPTIKYGDPNNMEDYQGGRTFDDLQTFAKENLGPSCGPANLDLCDAEQKAQIEEAMAFSDADLDTKIADGEKSLTDAEENFKAEVEKLQANYERLMKEKVN